MSDSSKIDLAFATTDELLSELARRHRPCMFAGIPVEKSGGNALVMGLHSDSLFDLMGMTQFMDDRIRTAAALKYASISPLYREGNRE